MNDKELQDMVGFTPKGKGQEATRIEAKPYFDEADTNNDKSLSYEEFREFIKKIRQAKAAAKALREKLTLKEIMHEFNSFLVGYEKMAQELPPPPLTRSHTFCVRGGRCHCRESCSNPCPYHDYSDTRPDVVKFELGEQTLDEALSEPIHEIVKTSSSSKVNFQQDMEHLIQFNNPSLSTRDQLMKGRPIYLKALRAYLEGDDTATVRMSYRNGEKAVLVADLNPRLASIAKLLESQPGSVRTVECL